MAKFIITGVPEFNGTYDHDTDRVYDGNELHLIKKIAGVRLGEIEEASEQNDYDLVIAVAVIALIRNQKIRLRDAERSVQILRGAELGALKFEDDVPEVTDEDPLSQTTTESTQNGSSQSSSEATSDTGEAQESTPLPTGEHG